MSSEQPVVTGYPVASHSTEVEDALLVEGLVGTTTCQLHQFVHAGGLQGVVDLQIDFEDEDFPS